MHVGIFSAEQFFIVALGIHNNQRILADKEKLRKEGVTMNDSLKANALPSF